MKTGILLSLFLLTLSFVGAAFAISSGIFIYKASTGLLGILICLILLFSKEKSSRAVVWILAAYAFSVAGDYFLSNMNEEALMFLMGILFYFIAHVGYLAYAWSNGIPNWKIIGLLLITFLGYFFVFLSPSIDDSLLRLGVLFYLLISCVTFGVAVGLKAPMVPRGFYIGGIGLILISDVLISLKEFLNISGLEFSILLTYYLAHSMITLALILQSHFSSSAIQPTVEP